MATDQDKQPVAAALRYNPPADHAPRVVAAGKGEVARRIIEVAGEAGVPVIQNETLARSLARMAVNAEIPQELYLAVAQVLAYIWQQDAQAGKLGGRSGG